MLVVRDVEVRAGARLLLEHASFQVAAGDKIGLVGRNGAGKTTLTRILSGDAQPASGTITEPARFGYLPQDPRTGDLDVLAKNRILSARGLDVVVIGCVAPSSPWATTRPIFATRRWLHTRERRQSSRRRVATLRKRRRPESPVISGCPSACCTSRSGLCRAVSGDGSTRPDLVLRSVRPAAR